MEIRTSTAALSAYSSQAKTQAQQQTRVEAKGQDDKEKSLRVGASVQEQLKTSSTTETKNTSELGKSDSPFEGGIARSQGKRMGMMIDIKV